MTNEKTIAFAQQAGLVRKYTDGRVCMASEPDVDISTELFNFTDLVLAEVMGMGDSNKTFADIPEVDRLSGQLGLHLNDCTVEGVDVSDIPKGRDLGEVVKSAVKSDTQMAFDVGGINAEIVRYKYDPECLRHDLPGDWWLHPTNGSVYLMTPKFTPDESPAHPGVYMIDDGTDIPKYSYFDGSEWWDAADNADDAVTLRMATVDAEMFFGAWRGLRLKVE